MTIKYEPFKVAIDNGIAYLEAHDGEDPQVLADYLGKAIITMSKLSEGKSISIDWEKFIRVAKESLGIPIAVNLGDYPLELVRIKRAVKQKEKKDYIF